MLHDTYMYNTFYRLKDSDITWLYGPVWLNHIEPPPKSQTIQDNLNLTPSIKSCLKKKSMSETSFLMIKGKYADTQLYKKNEVMTWI